MTKHTEDFKQEAVRIALTSGLSRRRFATDLGVGLSTRGYRSWHAPPKSRWSRGDMKVLAHIREQYGLKPQPWI